MIQRTVVCHNVRLRTCARAASLHNSLPSHHPIHPPSAQYRAQRTSTTPRATTQATQQGYVFAQAFVTTDYGKLENQMSVAHRAENQRLRQLRTQAKPTTSARKRLLCHTTMWPWQPSIDGAAQAKGRAICADLLLSTLTRSPSMENREARHT